VLLSEERAALAAAGRRLAERGLVIGTSGNLSARHGDLVAVTPTGGVISELTAEQMTVISLEDGSVVDGELAPTSEVPMHLAVYRATGAAAITHTHATTSTAIGLIADEIPLVHYTMLNLGGAVRVADYACYGTDRLAELVVKPWSSSRPPCCATTAPSPSARASPRPSTTSNWSNGPPRPTTRPCSPPP
jgi:L-fuculose-phosphate aldolase